MALTGRWLPPLVATTQAEGVDGAGPGRPPHRRCEGPHNHDTKMKTVVNTVSKFPAPSPRSGGRATEPQTPVVFWDECRAGPSMCLGAFV
jgi:hypothetical protein